MSVILRIVAVLISICAASAYAEAAPVIPSAQNNAQQQQTVLNAGQSFLPIAKLFGRDEFAWGTFTSTGGIELEYVPSGDDVNKWTRLVTVTVIPIADDTPDQMQSLITHFGDGLQKNGKVLDQHLYHDSRQNGRMFVEYEVGAGLLKEHSAGSLLKTAPKIAAFIQVQTRNIPVDPSDAENVKQFTEGKLHPPRPQ